MNDQFKKIQKSNEEHLYEIKRKTVPQEQSDTWRNPLNNQTPWYKKESKHYSEVEHLQHQMIYKENYHKPNLAPLMKASLIVLNKILEQEKESNKPPF